VNYHLRYEELIRHFRYLTRHFLSLISCHRAASFTCNILTHSESHKEVLEAIKDKDLIWFLASQGLAFLPLSVMSRLFNWYHIGHSLFFGAATVLCANVKVQGERRSIILLAGRVGTGMIFGKFALSSTLYFFSFSIGVKNLLFDKMLRPIIR
jgi:hypothetical protein